MRRVVDLDTHTLQQTVRYRYSDEISMWGNLLVISEYLDDETRLYFETFEVVDLDTNTLQQTARYNYSDEISMWGNLLVISEYLDDETRLYFETFENVPPTRIIAPEMSMRIKTEPTF